MAVHSITLTDQEESDFVEFLRGRSIIETIRQDYIDGVIKPAAANLRKQAVEVKRQELPIDAKGRVAQKEAELIALIEAEHQKLPPKVGPQGTDKGNTK